MEYHKLSIEKAYSNVLDENKIQKLFVTKDINQLKIIINQELNIETENLEEINRSMSVLLSPRSKQNEQDIKEISFKLAKEYTQQQTAEEFMKQHQKILFKYFRNKQVEDEWWEYIQDILNLIDNDYKISIALWKGKIFQNIPQVGIEHLATQCAKHLLVHLHIIHIH